LGLASAKSGRSSKIEGRFSERGGPRKHPRAGRQDEAKPRQG
jgi:hypothetical protein